MSTSTPTRYKPSNMIQALGLQAYDFRNDDSSASGSSDGDDDSSNSNGSNNNSDDDENSDDDGTKFDDGTNSNSNSRSASSSLRNSIETSAMDTVMTGDHVGALLKAYENEDDMPLPERWTQRRDSNCSSSRGSSSDDGLGAVDALLKNQSSVSNDRVSNPEKEEREAEATIRQRLNNAYAQVLTDESEHSGKSPRITIPTFKIKQSCKRRATNGSSEGESQLSSSLETNKEYEADMDELNKDFDEAECTSEADDLEKNSGPMGGNKDEHPVMFPHNYTSNGVLKSSTAKSTISAAQQSLKSSFSGHSNATPTMDNLTLQKLLFMDDDNTNDCQHQQDRNNSSSSPGRYHNLRGSLTSLKDNLAEKDIRGSLTNLKDNLAEKASLLSSSLGDTYVVRQTVPCNFENKRGKKMKRKYKRKKSVDSNDATIGRNGDGADDDGEIQKQSSGQDTDSGHDTDEEMGELKDREDDDEKGQDGAIVGGKVQESTFIDERSSMFNSYHYMQRDGGQPYFYRPGQRTIKRCIGILFAIAIIAVSSALIGFVIEDKNNNEDEAVHSPAPVLEDAAPFEESMDAIIEHSQYTREDLFQMAKSVDDHCHAEQLSTAHGRWECQQICHDHFCCFDFDVGDEAYNCRNDESKLCPIFAGCEVLVINDFVSGSSIVATGGAINTQAQNSGSSSYGSSESSTTTTTNNQQVMQNEDNNNNMGWKEIRKKYINVYCSESNVRSKEGRKQCEKVCENSFCCFDTVPGGNNCRDNKDMTCDAYESCQILLAEVNLIDNNGADQSPGGVPAGAGSDPGLPPPQDVHMPPDMVGDDISTDPMLGQWDDSTINNMLGYTKQELLVMKADIKERCKDYQSPTGRLQCEKMCKFHFCCFNDSEDGCQDNPAKLCHVYDECKVLISTVKDGNKGETKAPQAALISPETEQDMMGDDNHSEGYGNSKQISADNADPVASAPDMLESTPKPTQGLAPEPTLETPPPAMVTTSQTTAQTSSTATAGTLPKPPPIRCIPDGDDDLHTEVYTDDWNDDRYDRCKRWENKHGMSISEYWDLQGIDSELEKNILENMLIMDNADVEATAAEDEPSGGRNLAMREHSLKQGDLFYDGDIFEDRESNDEMFQAEDFLRDRVRRLFLL